MDKEEFKEIIKVMVDSIEDENDLQMVYGFIKACTEREKCTRNPISHHGS